jgi:hypothetical protein
MRWRDIPFHPPKQTLRWFAVYGFVFLSALAIWQLSQDDSPTALAFGLAAMLLGAVGALQPSLLRPVFVISMIATFPIGWTVSQVILALLFYGVFTPMAMLFRLIGRDALSRRIRPECETYWTEKPSAPDVRSYFRQS